MKSWRVQQAQVYRHEWVQRSSVDQNLPLAVPPALLSHYKEPKQSETVHWALKLQTSRLNIFSFIVVIQDAEIKRESLTLWFRNSWGRNIWALISRSTRLRAAARVRVIIDTFLFEGVAQKQHHIINNK